MRAAALLALVVLLPGCQDSAADAAVLDRARQTAALPNCPSLRVTDAVQARVAGSEEVRVIAEFAATARCIDIWLDGLAESGWLPQIHGGFVSPDGGAFAGGHRNGGFVIWYQHDLEPNIPDLRADFRP